MSTETVYGGTSDRYICAHEYGDYASAQGGANAYLDPLANEDAGVGQLTFGGSYYCEQFFFAVDLSGYDADGTASDATLSLYARDGSQQTDFPNTYEAYAYDWGAAVDTGDWRTPTNLGSMTLLASKTYTASGQVVTNAYTAFTSNSTNLASAVEAALGGTLYLMLTTSNFRLGNEPSGISDHIVWWTADHGSGYQPRLVFEYTEAASGRVLFPDFFGGLNCDMTGGI